MESPTSSHEVLVCQTCGAEGFTNAFIYCVKCLKFVVHRYCLDVIPRTSDETVIWFCEDCKQPLPNAFTLPPKHDPSQSQKEDAVNSAPLKKTHPKKKQKRKHKKKQLKKRKIVSLVSGKDNECVSGSPNLASGKDNECVSGAPNQISKRVIVLGLAKPDLQNQFSEYLPSQKTNVTCPPHVKTTKRKKKPKKKAKKKRKIVPLVSYPEEAIKPNNECVSPKISPPKESSVKSDSRPNQITPSAEKGVLHKHSTESAELDGSKTDVNATSLNVKTKGNETEKAASSIGHSSCESSCTDVTLKIKEDKLVSESIEELDKKSVNGQLEVENMMHNKDDVRVSRSGSVSQSAYLENNLQYIHFQSARPVLDPIWRGSFSITQTDYNIFEGFVGHLSSKACYKVCEEATTLPSLLRLEMRSKPDLWPKSFLESPPSDENIALYFFPGNAENERDFEELVNDMIEEDLAMKATAKNAELLIFTSKVLPRSYWRFQGNYYLWGVFRGKRNDDHDLPASNNSNNKNSLNKVTSEKEILTTVKTIESHSPQSPLCNYR